LNISIKSSFKRRLSNEYRTVQVSSACLHKLHSATAVLVSLLVAGPAVLLATRCGDHTWIQYSKCGQI